jgi:hypothetical protein
MRADGRRPILLAPAAPFIGQNTPVYSPDGTRVALRSCGFGICPLFTRSSGGPTTTFGVLNGATGEPQLFWPDWQPLLCKHHGRLHGHCR